MVLSELNAIQVRWMWLQRIAINNSMFRGEPEIGHAVQEWTDDYNITHSRRIIDIA
jgi:hypothetical protein